MTKNKILAIILAILIIITVVVLVIYFYPRYKFSYENVKEMYPNVLYTHTADMIASKIRGI